VYPYSRGAGSSGKGRGFYVLATGEREIRGGGQPECTISTRSGPK